MKTPMLVVCVCMLVSLLTSGTVGASTISQTQSTGPAAETDWVKALTFQKFDSSLGTLLSVKVTVTGYLIGDMLYENRSASPCTIVMNLCSDITVKKAGTTLATASPIASVTEAAAAYDTLLDWDGASGSSFMGQANTTTGTSYITTAPAGM